MKVGIYTGWPDRMLGVWREHTTHRDGSKWAVLMLSLYWFDIWLEFRRV